MKEWKTKRKKHSFLVLLRYARIANVRVEWERENEIVKSKHPTKQKTICKLHRWMSKYSTFAASLRFHPAKHQTQFKCARHLINGIQTKSKIEQSSRHRIAFIESFYSESFKRAWGITWINSMEFAYFMSAYQIAYNNALCTARLPHPWSTFPPIQQSNEPPSSDTCTADMQLLVSPNATIRCGDIPTNSNWFMSPMYLHVALQLTSIANIRFDSIECH